MLKSCCELRISGCKTFSFSFYLEMTYTTFKKLKFGRQPQIFIKVESQYHFFFKFGKGPQIKSTFEEKLKFFQIWKKTLTIYKFGRWPKKLENDLKIFQIWKTKLKKFHLQDNLVKAQIWKTTSKDVKFGRRPQKCSKDLLRVLNFHEFTHWIWLWGQNW